MRLAVSCGTLLVIACSAPPEETPVHAAAGTCAPLAGVPDLDEVGLTPRANLEAELLAARCSTGLFADPELYDNVVADLAAMRAADPGGATVVDVTVQAATPPITLGLYLSVDAAASTRDGTHPDLACAVSALGGTSEVQGQTPSLVLPGVYAHGGLARVLRRVPGVAGVQTPFVFDGPRTWADPRGAARVYVMEARGGDCPSGCTTVDAYLWHVGDSEPAHVVEEWHPGQSGQPAPWWLVQARNACRTCEDGSITPRGATELCNDGVDNDCNGATDCADDTCTSAATCQPELCTNGADDNANGLADCQDVDACARHAACGGMPCSGAEDRAALERIMDVRSFITRLGLACDQRPSVQSCVDETLVANGVSAFCAACHSELAACSLDACAMPCQDDFTGAACADCQRAACLSAIQACVAEPPTWVFP